MRQNAVAVACLAILVPAAAQNTSGRPVVSPSVGCAISSIPPKQKDTIAELAFPALKLGSLSGRSQAAGSCSTQAAPVPFTLEYRAYIPYDHVQGSNYPGCVLSNKTGYSLYLGDSPGSTLPSGPPLTYRASIFSVVTPNSPIPVSFVTPDTGISYQFSQPSSPIQPPFITAGDYDGIFYDCYLENQEGQAQFAPAQNNNGTYQVTNSTSANSVTVTNYGNVANPLAVPALKIGWNFQTAITVNSASQTASIAVTSGLLGGVTCFPAHEVLVDSQTVAYYLPTASNVIYIGLCLSGPPVSALVGPATAPGGVTMTY